MRLRCVLTFALAVSPVAAAAQTSTADGVHAYLRGDYETAAAILRGHAEHAPQPDPIAQFFLATLYDSGRGVPRNQMRACGLYLSAGATANPLMPQALDIAEAIREPWATAVRDLICAPATTHPWSEAQPASFSLGPGHSVRIDGSGMTIAYEGVERRTMGPYGGAGLVSLPVQYTPLDVSQPVVVRRHFIQFFTWHRNDASDTSTWSLGWMLVEVVGAEMFMITGDPRLTIVTVTEPPAAIDTARAVSVRVNASGEAEWVINDPAGPRGGVIPLSQKK
jgi:hypothetical protein